MWFVCCVCVRVVFIVVGVMRCGRGVYNKCVFVLIFSSSIWCAYNYFSVCVGIWCLRGYSWGLVITLAMKNVIRSSNILLRKCWLSLHYFLHHIRWAKNWATANGLFSNANHSIVQIKTIHSYLVHSPHGHRIYFPIFLHRSVRRHTYIIIIMKNTQNSPTHTCTLRCTPLFIHSLIRQCTTCMRLAVFLGWDRRLTAVILSHKIWFYHT